MAEERSYYKSLWGIFLISALALAAGVSAGCGGRGPNIAEVTGTVTLNGSPLPYARLEFQPEGPGTYSTGLTDEQGKYRLVFSRQQKGALVGTHSVTISTAVQGGSDENGNPQMNPELVPPQYNRDSTLVVEVERKRNKIDFDLEGEVPPPSARARR